MKPESGPMEGDYLWREFLMYWHELTFGAFKLIKINQESGEKKSSPSRLGPALHATTLHRSTAARATVSARSTGSKK